MPLIDNEQQTLQEALRNALSSADRIDISVGFFYFSGFQSLAEELRDKKVRILVGLEVDANLIPEITQRAKEGDEDLYRWQPREEFSSRSAIKKNYIDGLIGFINDSDIFDNEKAVEILDLFVNKIKDGSLEIRKTVKSNHAKFYVIHNKPEFSDGGDYPGKVFMGSSNLTYKGLMGQGELNDSYRDKDKYEEYKEQFERLWDDSKAVTIADKHTSEEFVKGLKSNVWVYRSPKPYHVYLRVLHELFFQEFDDNLKTPGKITNERYLDFEYQVDAIRGGLDRLERFDGVILADVVGLGKSIIASAIARNLDIKSVIIAPPHLNSQWEDYKEQFGIRGSKVFSSGKIDEVHERYQQSNEPRLFILDEAHRYRNEDTNNYQKLHQVCRSHPDNKVMLLTATPFNNDPKDVFALIKLFQTPGQSTIRSVDNLSMRFHNLIGKYKNLRRKLSKLSQEKIDEETNEIALEQRRLIESVVIRRSRLDLKHITRYKQNLMQMGIEFPKVVGPELLEYELGDLTDLYLHTLNQITGSRDSDGFIGARYKPSTYVKDREAFREKFKDELEESDLKTAQTNLSQFMKRLLVMRFESSKEAFRSTLRNMIESNEIVARWWNELHKVPIMKKGQIPDPDNFSLEDGSEGDDFDEQIEDLKENKRLIAVDREMLGAQFIEDVKRDIELLKDIERQWFDSDIPVSYDPKIDELRSHIEKLLEEMPDRKIVIFSAYADTVNYLYEHLTSNGFEGVAKYTAGDATKGKRREVQKNFDASLPDSEREDDYDVLIATDALSEGINLHRAGVIINYDIPYNPTRVIQRIGRINRINKKVYDKIYIYNCFPSPLGEDEVRIKRISTLKMQLINSVVGSDTRTLTPDEELVSYFKDEYKKAKEDDENLSWDAPHIEAYDMVKTDKELMKEVLNLPRRSRILRDSNIDGVVVFGKKGDHSVFTFGNDAEDMEIISAEEALPYFKAEEDEEGEEVAENFNALFNTAKDELFKKHELPQIKGRRADAINRLKALASALPSARDYCEDIITIIKEYDDLSDGALKEIKQVDLSDVKEAHKNLKDIIPEEFVRNVLERAKRVQKENELILFAEQLKS